MATTVTNGRSPSNATPRDNRPLVLVVDDEESYRQALASGLHREGFAVECAGDGHEALRLFHRVDPDLVLLDVMLPDLSGIELCQQMRALKPVPIIMVTARDSEVDVVLGLELGASDYVPKPFRLRELVARMRAVLRRGVGCGRTPAKRSSTWGPVRLDAGRREVDGPRDRRSSSPARSSTSCPSSCRTAARSSPGTGCIDRLWWDQELTDTRTLDTHIKRLRRKIEPDPANPRHLVTVRASASASKPEPLTRARPGISPYIVVMRKGDVGTRLRAARPDRHSPQTERPAGRRPRSPVLLSGRHDLRLHQGELPLPRPRAEFAAVGAQRVGISADSVDKQKQFDEKESLG